MAESDAVGDLKRGAQAAHGTLGPACKTCAFFEPAGVLKIWDKCNMFAVLEPSDERETWGRCKPEGLFWEPKPPRLGLIPWFRRLLWGDATPSDPERPDGRR